MPQHISFDPKNKNTTIADYPKLKLGKDEMARILCIEKEPIFAYVHTLRAPTVINGKPKKVMQERRNGEEVEVYKYDFIGRPLCLGDEGVLADQGIDTKNCPICAMARESEMAYAPDRRFAMHVIKYATKPGSAEISVPFSCQLVVWSFPDSIFNKLVDIANEWGSLREHDLRLGPCINESFQKFEISVAREAAWMLEDPSGVDRKALVAQTFKENQTSELVAFCGRKVSRKFVEEDLEKIRARWRVVNAAESGEAGDSLLADVGASSALKDGISDLLQSHSGGASEVASKPAASADELSDLLNGSSDTAEAAPVPEPVKETKPETEAAAEKSSNEPMSFDDLINS